jgi:hypothetical protein
MVNSGFRLYPPMCSSISKAFSFCYVIGDQEQRRSHKDFLLAELDIVSITSFHLPFEEFDDPNSRGCWEIRVYLCAQEKTKINMLTWIFSWFFFFFFFFAFLTLSYWGKQKDSRKFFVLIFLLVFVSVLSSTNKIPSYFLNKKRTFIWLNVLHSY